MLVHYLALAVLTHRARPLTALLSLLTLALGFVCFLTAYGVAAFWDRADRHFANAERTFVVSSEWEAREARGEELRTGVVPRTNPWLARYLRTDFPELEAVARAVSMGDDTPVSAGDRAVRLRTVAADPELLAIFDLPFVAGDPRAALREPRAVLLTSEAAQRLFGDADPIGRRVVLANRLDATVTGVLGPIVEPSHMGRSAAAPLSFDMLVSRDLYEASVRFAELEARLGEDWTWQGLVTYVLLPRDGSLTVGTLRAALPAFVERHVPAEQIATFSMAFDLVPVTDLLGMALNESLFLHRTGVSAASLLLALGVLVLTVACLDFANLAAARAVRRAREVGMRKALGAKAAQVLVQHLLEVGLLAAAALVVAAGAVTALAPAIESVTGIDPRLPLRHDPGAWGVLAVALLAVTLAAGIHPALTLARVPAIAALRAGALRSGPRSLGAWLVAIQFAGAVFLLIAVTVVQQQNARLERTALGAGAPRLVVIENDPEATGLEHATLRQALLALPQVQAATQLEHPPWTVPSGTMPLARSPDGGYPGERTALLHVVGEDFFEVFGIRLLAGRAFDPARSEDLEVLHPLLSRTQHIVVSRSLAAAFGFASPAEAVDQVIYIPSGNGPTRPQRIIGVVDDEPINISTGTGARPGVFLFDPHRRQGAHVVKIAPHDVAGALAEIDALWKRLVPGVPVSRRFADEYFNDAYANFVQLHRAFSALALAALAIATMGLFAMASLAASRRTHEIGVRKTLGASSGEIVRLLLASLSGPVLIGNAAAWPIAYIAAQAYLSVFIDPVRLTAWPFVAAMAATALVAVLAIGGQTLRAARTVPGRVLRQE